MESLREYGWAGVVIYVAIKEIWPWLRKRLDKSMDDGAQAREAQLAREAAREERMVRAMENMDKTSSGILRVLSVMDLRIGLIERHLGLPTPEPDMDDRTMRKRGAAGLD
jgi:hypothetical protein